MQTVIAVQVFIASLVVLFTCGYVITESQCPEVDPLDVNRDGVANIQDLSVLAAELNARNQVGTYGTPR